MNQSKLRAVEQREQLHPRELARQIIRERAQEQKGGLAEIHDPAREVPAPSLPVDDLVRSATYQIPDPGAPTPQPKLRR